MMTEFEQKLFDYYRIAAMGCRTDEKPKYVPAKIKVKETVRSEGGSRTFVLPGVYECESNQYGAVSVKSMDGSMLGIYLNEFDVVEWAENKGI